jgi:predicted metalloprotease with PDZ domain
MPRALPQPGDGGLDGSRGIGRVYWGGALFWLLADIEIRKQTHNRKGLQDAFRRIMAEDGTMQWEWDINEIFATGDRATATKVLSTLYREWKDKPVSVDLEKLWQQLGIERKKSSVAFNDRAPLVAIRIAIGGKSPR